jgi:hypothetical protein
MVAEVIKQTPDFKAAADVAATSVEAPITDKTITGAKTNRATDQGRSMLYRGRRHGSSSKQS